MDFTDFFGLKRSLKHIEDDFDAFRANTNPNQSSSSSSDAEDSSASNGGSPEGSFERVINVKNCPLCHRPRLNSKAEVDIVTHLAVCASQDWARVDRIVVGNYVTASQAQRKWYTKVISKVSAGNYKLGVVRVIPFIFSREAGADEVSCRGTS